jgi:fermentation-respiration switch protein FrsA (DUF1100 family)
MRREEKTFDAEGTPLAAWLYRPPGDGPHPVVVMAHGFSAVKELYLDAYAEAFAEAGLAALVFDHRGFGASGGEPRQEIDPVAQVRDYRHAITFVRTLEGIDAQRIGVWGSSYSGGHALVVGAIDRRVRCVVSQVPAVSGPHSVARLIRSDLLPEVRAMLDADRAARAAGEAPGMVPVVSEDPAGLCALPGTEAAQWFLRNAERAPAWRNEVTLRSVEMLMEYEPATWVARISPTPLMMIVAEQDTLAHTDLALDAFAAAREPKELVMIEGGHFDPYETHFAIASGAARDFLAEHL